MIKKLLIIFASILLIILFLNFITKPDYIIEENVFVNDYYEIAPFSNGVALVDRDKKFGYINDKGQEVIPCQYDGGTSFSDGVARVLEDGEFKNINKKGEEISLPYNEYVETDEIKEEIMNLKRVCKNDKFGYENEKGKIIIKCQYDEATQMSEGIAVVKKDGKDYILKIR